MPDTALERALSRRHSAARIAGIDEAGRGPWAGPVVAAAVVLDLGRVPAALARGLDDSKKLSAARREALCAALADAAAAGLAEIGIGAASVAEIDRDNILAATFRAMCRAAAALPRMPDAALVDGNRLPPGLGCPAEAVVGGDARALTIAAASIVAKTTRDRLMAALARRYPAFGWERNAGYGTAQHRDGLAAFGITAHHRRSFAPVAALIG